MPERIGVEPLPAPRRVDAAAGVGARGGFVGAGDPTPVVPGPDASPYMFGSCEICEATIMTDADQHPISARPKP